MRIDAQAVLNDLYQKFESNSEVSISAPEYDQLQIDYLIESGLLTKNDVSTLSGWTYLVRPTYEGKAFIRQLKDAPIAKLYEFIQRGEEIGKKERRPAGCGFAVSYVSGPLYNAWMDEINIFNERYLKKHPMHDQIFQTYFHRRNRPSAYEDMMGHLQALSTDDEFNVKKIEKGRVESVKIRNQAVSRMLQKDINRCKSFLSDSKDESVGLDLYIEITSRYDSIIPNLGAGLYKMKLDAIKHQGVTSAQVGQKLLSVEKVADDAGESRNQIKRYIRLTYLIPELLSMVDDGKIAFNPAVELSYLDSYQQRAVLDAMSLNDCTPSHAQSIRLKKLAQEGLLDDQIVYAVLAETKPNQQEQLKFKREELRKYFPSGYTEEQMRRDIIKGLELLKRQRERNRDAR